MCIRDRDYTAFTQFPNGTTVKVIGTDGDWLKVILPEKIGYVYSCLLYTSESAVEVPYADDTSGVYKISMVRMSTTD